MSLVRHPICLVAVVLVCAATGCGKSHPDCCECSYSGLQCSGSAIIQGSNNYASCQEACEAQDMRCPLESAAECKAGPGGGPDASVSSRRDSAAPSLPDSSSPPSGSSICCTTPSISYCNCYDRKVCASDEVPVSSCPRYGHCCQNSTMSDFCTCWDLSCSETSGSSYEVSGCP
jgi:hypothetical protein